MPLLPGHWEVTFVTATNGKGAVVVNANDLLSGAHEQNWGHCNLATA